jgi:HK97 family phage prohead protease
MDRLSYPVELKFADGARTGAFDGYASVFGGIDTHGDMVMPGAFTRTLAERKAQGRAPGVFYLQHARELGIGDQRPAGVWDSIAEDARGLQVAGHLVGLDTETGKYNHALIKEGAMGGLSIEFKAKKADYPNGAGQPRRVLRDVDLFGVSLVADPSDAAARVASIKSIATITDCSRELHALGFPRSVATKMAQAWLAATGTESNDDDELAALAARIVAATLQLRKGK